VVLVIESEQSDAQIALRTKQQLADATQYSRRGAQ